MDDLQRGDRLILIQDGSEWEFDSYGQTITHQQGIPGLVWSGSQSVEGASIFVRPLAPTGETQERMPDEFKPA